MAAAGIELNLPDLPEVPIRLGPVSGRPGEPGPKPATKMPWGLRLREALTAYLPLLMMVLLALGSWWLVKNSPQPLVPKPGRAATGEPDYTMRGFTLQRFGPDGQLKLTLEGRQLHHFPDTDRIEIEELYLTALGSGDRQTVATARKALSNGQATDVQLLGGAQLRGRTPDGQPIEIDSEFLHILSQAERITSDRRVQLRVGSNLVTAGGLVWDHPGRVLELKPPIRAVLPPPGRTVTEGAP